MRGRLINQFSAELVQYDASATSEDPAGASPEPFGFSDVFREPVRLPPASDEGAGESNRRERPPVRIPVQVEYESWDKLKMLAAGNDPTTRLVLVAHFRWLEENGFVDRFGNATIYVADRVTRILDIDGAPMTSASPESPLYVTHVLPAAYGLGKKRNLLLMTVEPRNTALS